MEKTKVKLNKLFKSLDGFAKTDVKYLIKGSFWLTSANLITSIIVLATSIVFANQIPPETYGTYKYFISILGILSISTLSGIGSTVSQAVSRGLEGSLFTGLKIKILYGLFGSLASVIIAIYYALNGNVELAVVFGVATFFIPFMDSFHIYQNYLQGKKIFDKSSIYISISQAFASSVMIITVFLTTNLYIILSSYLISWTCIRIFFFLKTITIYPPNKLVDPKTIPLGKHSSYIDIIATLIGSLDSILIFHFLGSIQLAVYSFAIAPVTQIVSLFRNIPTLATPKLANRPVKEIDELLFKRILIVAGVAAVIFITYILSAQHIYEIFFPKYLDSVIISKVYALTILISIPITILSSAVNAKITYFSKRSLYLWNIPGALSTIFMLITIQSLGIMSVVYARIILLITTAIMSYLFWLYVVEKDSAQHKINPSDTNKEFETHNDLN